MKKKRELKIGKLYLGGNNPIRVESMLKAPPEDIQTNIEQLKKLEEAGCELVRVSIPNRKALILYRELKKVSTLPLMGDMHFSASLLQESIEEGMEAVRINPANIPRENLVKLIPLLKEREVVVRIGVNSASFHPPLPRGEEGAQKMIDVAVEWIKEFQKKGHHHLLISLKSSDVLTTILANLKISELFDYPIHIGITEAGMGKEGIVKSSVGLGILLYQGIGDTVRVSLTGPPEEEVQVAYYILRTLGLREYGPEIISCPQCGRSRINVEALVKKLKKNIEGKWRELSGLRIAIMGCEVNGPGEAQEADIGIAGGKKHLYLFKKGKIFDKLPENEAWEVFLKELGKLTRC